MSDMSNYFEIAEKQGAVLMDASNFSMVNYPLMTNLKKTFIDLANGKIQLGYDDPAGSNVLKGLIARHESSLEGIALDPTNIVAFPGGVTGAFNNIFKYLSKIDPNCNEIIIPAPSYPELERSVLYNGLKPVFVQTTYGNNFQPTVQDISNSISKRTAGIFITSPGNPSSKRISQEMLYGIVKVFEGIGAYVILDAIFEEFELNPHARPFLSMSEYPRLIKLKGLSKDRPHMNDFRIGWGISKDIDTMQGLYTASELAGFSISMIIDALATSEMRLRVEKDESKKNKIISKELRIYIDELAEFYSNISKGISLSEKLLASHPVVENYSIPDAGNVLFIQIKNQYVQAKNLAKDGLFHYLLENANIGVTPGHIFHVPDDQLWFRVTMSKEPEYFAQQLDKALEVLK